MPYDVAAIRNKLKSQMSGKFVDPDEFRPPKSDGNEIKYRFFILPPIMAGDQLKSGKVKDDQSMEHFFVPHANHWVNDRPHPCPRVWAGDGHGDCAICQTGFDLLKDEKDEDVRKNIVKQWMPNTYYMVNIFFTNSNVNPEDLRGKVKFFNAPKTLFDVWSSTLMKDDAGDSEDPQAYGVFFDETAAFLFQLEVQKQGRNNSYKTSKFIANGGQPQPMLNDPAKLAQLLRMRHNLFEKIEKPDSEKVGKLARTMLDGDDLDDSGFDQDEVKSKPTQRHTEAKRAEQVVESKKSVPKPAPKDEILDDIIDDDDVLAGETPLVDDEDVKPVVKQSSKPTPKPDPKPTPKSQPADDEGDDDIDALLDQLEDND